MARKYLVIIAIVAGILLVFASIAAIVFLRNNTSFLNFNVSPTEIAQNNSNEQLPRTDILTLVPQDLETNSQLLTNTTAVENRQLALPENFTIEVYAADLSEPRGFDFDESGNIIVADRNGRLILVEDSDSDGVAETNRIIDTGLNKPHGVEWHEGDLYVGEETQVSIYRDLTARGGFSSHEVLIENLPAGGHNSRTVHIGPDDKLYLAVGSSCNVCEESDEQRAAISRYTMSGEFEKVYAHGLRNTVDFLFTADGEDFQIWGVDNGRDLIGDDLPPEEVNIIIEDGHYGWPYCYGDGIANPEYPERSEFCANESVFPIFNLQAHSAPLGLAMTSAGLAWPEGLESNLVIGFHGSWNRSVPTGYKVVRIPMQEASGEAVNFITGWLDESGEVWGRPVHLAFDENGRLFISDDQAGVIYKVSYTD